MEACRAPTDSASRQNSIAGFITPHGFGHAARATAVMEAMHHRMPGLNFEIYSSVPHWFFAESLAEIFQAGIPFGYIPRQRFRESAVLEAFVHEQMCGIALHPEQLADGSWAEHVPQLLAMSKIVRKTPNGAEQAAE